MKQRKSFTLSGCGLTSICSKIALSLILLCVLFFNSAVAQCGAGYSQVTLNWDNLDYFSYSGNYVSGTNGYLSSNALVKTQNFAFGTQRLTITNNYADAGVLGENGTHTGDAGSYGIGKQDINFNGNGPITLTFENEVENLKFSIYDVDNSQSVTVTGQNAASVAQNVTMAKTNGASALVIVGSGGTSPIATSLAVGGVGNSSSLASLNIDIAGPVKTITITTGGSSGDFWISNIIACSAGSFPNNYYSVSKPFTGQPGYVLHAFDDDVYAVNPATGVTKYIFTDPGGNVNSMGYDPYNRVLYYVNSLTANPGTNKAIKKYDFNTGTITTIVPDITTALGIPVVVAPVGNVRGTGVESGAAAFYNGSFFLGIETNNKNSSGGTSGTSGREVVIWRIDFTGTTPYRSCQVYATPTDDGAGNMLHDWSDFAIKDGILYDFDGAASETDIYQYNMTTSATTNFNSPAGFTPGQPTIDWNGNIWQTYANANTLVAPYIALYNPVTGTIGTNIALTSSPAYTPAIPSLGDAAEGYRPLVDFGDAPATYDPVAGDPAVHEMDTKLYLGSASGTHEDAEWVTRGQTVLANADNFEDGLGAAPPLLNFAGTVTYTVSGISVFNNTGANATLEGWLDFNMNGVFDVGEGRTTALPIPSSASAQLVSLTWTSIHVPFTIATATYLRLRLTRAANGMTASKMTGYMPDGEVEDYRVTLGINLPVDITSFDLQKGNGKTANLKWTTSGDMTNNAAFEIERSADAQQWLRVGSVNSTSLQSSPDQFSYKDENALSGKSYYRIKIVSKDGAFKYTEVKSISFSYLKGKITVSPNPVTDYITIQLSSENASSLKIALYDHSGKTVYEKNVKIVAGDNSIQIMDVKNITSGMYYIKLSIGDEIFTDKLIVAKN